MRTKPAILIAAVIVALSTVPLLISCSPPEAAIRAALASTVVDHFSFADAAPVDAVAVILKALHEQHPDLGHVSVITHSRVTTDGVSTDLLANRRLTCDLRRLPADTALIYVTRCSNADFTVRSGSIHLYAPDYRHKPPPLTLSERALDALFWQVWGVFH